MPRVLYLQYTGALPYEVLMFIKHNKFRDICFEVMDPDEYIKSEPDLVTGRWWHLGFTASSSLMRSEIQEIKIKNWNDWQKAADYDRSKLREAKWVSINE